GDERVAGPPARGSYILAAIPPPRQIGDADRVALLSAGNGATLQSTGGGATLQSTGRGATLQSTGRGATLQSTGRGATLQSTGRRATLSGSPVLFKPQAAYRVRQNTNTDTPIPPDEAAGVNPPDGAIIDYMLAADAPGRVTLDILDAAGRLVRRYASDDPIERADPTTAPVPVYWYRPPQTLSAAAGLHRFLWDLH